LLFLLFGLQVTCNGEAVSGKFEVRVDPTHLRFTLHPDRALNLLTPGPFSVGQFAALCQHLARREAGAIV